MLSLVPGTWKLLLLYHFEVGAFVEISTVMAAPTKSKYIPFMGR